MTEQLRVRPVQAADKDRVLQFTAHTWGAGGDYIEDVFDEWLADRAGEFTAALVGNDVVGIAKLTHLGSGEWWFEGLRIDPAFRRRGIALALNRHQVALARQLGGTVIRYMTGGENVGSQAIGARAGFQHMLTLAAYVATPDAQYERPALLTEAHLPALSGWLASPLVSYQHGTWRNGWQVRTISAAELVQAVRDKRVYGLIVDDTVRAYAVLRSAEFDDDSEDAAAHPRLRVDHLDGEAEALTTLARQLRGLAHATRREVVSAGISDYAPLVDAVTRAGYTLNAEHFSLWVLELKL